MLRRTLLLVGVAVTGLLVSASIATAGPLPTGERTFHQATLEPAYNAASPGQIGYLLTPSHAPMMAPPNAWAPIYVVVYPVGTKAASTLSCMHIPFENCPSHGNAIAGAAMGALPGVYGGGVLGHDHVLDFPGGDDFHIAWEPIVVLFTNKAAADHHLLTDGQIAAAQAAGDVVEVPLPDATFNCAVVPAALWDRATP